MKVEIWADIVCPWCRIGKRHFDDALALFSHRNAVEVHWRSFQLDPDAPMRSSESMADMLSRKVNLSHDDALATIARTTAVAAMAGLEFRLDEAIPVNSSDLHRLVHLAADHGRQDVAVETLMNAYFSEARDLSDRKTLTELMGVVGVAEQETLAVLDGDEYVKEVELERRTASDLGVTGVPFFVVDQRFAVSGAQSSDTILDVLQQAWEG